MNKSKVTDEEVITAIKRARGPATIDYLKRKFGLSSRAATWRIIRRLKNAGIVRESEKFKSLGKRGFSPATYEVVKPNPSVIHRRISTHQPERDVKRDALTCALFGEYHKEAA